MVSFESGSRPALGERLESRGVLAQWSANPRLEGLAHLDQLHRWTAQSADHQRADEVLGALVELAVAGDEDAVLVLLHLLEPGVRRIAAEIRQLHPTPFELVIGELVGRIRCYPLARRPGAVAANLLRDTRQRIWRELRCYRSHHGRRPDLLVERAELFDLRPLLPRRRAEQRVLPGPDNSEIDVVDLLVWARNTGLVDPYDLSLLVEVEYAREEPGGEQPVALVAERHGCSARTVQRRCARALASLQAHRDRYLVA